MSRSRRVRVVASGRPQDSCQVFVIDEDGSETRLLNVEAVEFECDVNDCVPRVMITMVNVQCDVVGEVCSDYGQSIATGDDEE